MLIQQALYGEQSGAHRLLAKSCDEKEPFGELEFFTDRPGDPPARMAWGPFISGFALEGHWIFAKTFPDATASRPGMVLTCVLVLPLEEVIHISNVGPLLDLLPKEFPPCGARTSVALINWLPADQADDGARGALPEAAGVGAVVHALFGTEGGKRPIVWLGHNGFRAVIEGLWRHLPPRMRASFRFRHSFEVQDTERHAPTLVATPSDLVGRWTDFTCVRADDAVPPPSLAEAFLRGLPEGEAVRKVLDQLEVEPDSLRQIQLAQECCRHTDAAGTSVADARALARLVSALAPDPQQGIAFKAHVLKRFSEATQQGEATDVLALRNFDPRPFPDGEKVQRIAGVWVKTRFLKPSRLQECLPVLEAAFDQPSTPTVLNQSWAHEVKTSVKEALASWPREGAKDSATALWGLWQRNSHIVGYLEPLLPSDENRLTAMGRDLAETCPLPIENALGDTLMALAARREWFLLNAHLLLATVGRAPAGHAEAWRQQLRVDRDQNSWEGVRVLGERTSPETQLEVALSTNDERVLALAGQVCARQSGLLARLDVEQAQWRRIWREAIAAGASPWQGIPDPQTVMFALVDRALRNEPVEAGLLLSLSATPLANLMLHPQRAQVWNRLGGIEPRLKTAFLEATATGWWQAFESSQGPDAVLGEPLESPLQEAVLEETRLWSALERARQSDKVFTLFERFASLPSTLFGRWLDHWFAAHRTSVFTFGEAFRLSQLVQKWNWRDIAQKLAANAHRPGVLEAAQACSSLLSLFEHLRLKSMSWTSGSWTSGGSDKKSRSGESISADELWQLWGEVAAQHYPWGSGDQNLWKRARGDEAQLIHRSTGKASWTEALHLLRRGGGGKGISAERLLSEMRQDFPRSEQLEFLWQHRERLND